MDAQTEVFVKILQLLPPAEFENAFRDLLGVIADDVLANSSIPADRSISGAAIEADAQATITLTEPDGTARRETWLFELKRSERIDTKTVFELRSRLSKIGGGNAIYCLTTPFIVTRPVRDEVALESRLRIWDQSFFEKIARERPDLAAGLSRNYRPLVPDTARERLPAEQVGSAMTLVIGGGNASATGSADSASARFEGLMKGIPTGQANFARYEQVVVQILEHLFGDQLGKPQSQVTTADGTQRRDILFKNRQGSRFWQLLHTQFGCNFLIVDAKNYGNPLDPSVIDDVSKYASEALGRYILVVSRKGAASPVEAHQIRAFKGLQKVMIVIVSDDDLIEMVRLKEAGQPPESLLEDATDRLLVRC